MRQVLHQSDNSQISNGTTVYWTNIIEIAIEFVERLFFDNFENTFTNMCSRIIQNKYHVKRANSFHHCPLGDNLTSIQESNKNKK